MTSGKINDRVVVQRVQGIKQMREAIRDLPRKDADLLRHMAGYRNRIVYFYNEISAEELFDICAHHLDEI